MEKDKSGASNLYPLTDFSPRTDEAFERGYMRGRYGALPILPTDSSETGLIGVRSATIEN